MMKRVLLLVLLAALTHLAFSQTRMFYFVPKLMSWAEAQTHCRQNYIDLATIDDQTDQEEMMRVIRQFYNKDVWTGLSRTDADASWIWSDQSPSTFMPWVPTQPNNWEGNQYCVIVTPGANFNDLDCKSKFPSVCYTEKQTDGETGGQIKSKCERSCSEDKDSAAGRKDTEGEGINRLCKTRMENPARWKCLPDEPEE